MQCKKSTRRLDETLLRVDGLGVERGGRLVIAGLSLTLDRGETVLVTGRNGAGKSTLLRALAGLLAAQAGRVAYGLADEETRGVETVHYLGYEDALKPTLSVEENLAFWASMLATSSSAKRVRGTMRGMVEGAAVSSGNEEVRLSPPPPPEAPLPRFAEEGLAPADALAAFGIARLAALPATYLSAGQKRRVALARLLLAPRPIWLLDEPLIALDAGAQATLTALMAHHTTAGGAILVASHQPLALPHRTIDLAAR